MASLNIQLDADDIVPASYRYRWLHSNPANFLFKANTEPAGVESRGIGWKAKICVYKDHSDV